MQIEDIMTAQPRTASPRTTLAEAAQVLWNADCGILPVTDEGKLVGVITDRDMSIALGKPVRNEQVVDALKAICAHRPVPAVVAA
jgi:CBS domain-containing protein